MTALSYTVELMFTSGAILEIWATCSPDGYGVLAVLIKNRVDKITDFGLE